MSTHIIKTLRFAIAAFAIFAIAPTMIFAQGEIFTDCDAWEAAVCGSILNDDFESFVGFTDVPLENGFFGVVPSPQTFAWGELSQSGNVPDGVSVFFQTSFDISSGLFFDDVGDGRQAVFTPNIAVLGPLEGVCFNYVADDAASVVSFNAFDGDTLVASIPLPLTVFDGEDPIVNSFGWRNTDGLNVTRFEFVVDGESAVPTGLVGDGQLSFGDGCDPPEVSCFDQLAAVEASLADLVGTLSGNDAYFADGALGCIRWMQQDFFWVQPSENRLTQYGGSLFIGAAYTIAYLEWVDDPAADVLIDDLIAVLECIVDNEIAYAIENGGNTCFIERAEDFAELGEIIDDDFDNEVIASLAYRLAWLNAFYATQ